MNARDRLQRPERARCRTPPLAASGRKLTIVGINGSSDGLSRRQGRPRRGDRPGRSRRLGQRAGDRGVQPDHEAEPAVCRRSSCVRRRSITKANVGKRAELERAGQGHSLIGSAGAAGALSSERPPHLPRARDNTPGFRSARLELARPARPARNLLARARLARARTASTPSSRARRGRGPRRRCRSRGRRRTPTPRVEVRPARGLCSGCRSPSRTRSRRRASPCAGGSLARVGLRPVQPMPPSWRGCVTRGRSSSPRPTCRSTRGRTRRTTSSTGAPAIRSTRTARREARAAARRH